MVSFVSTEGLCQQRGAGTGERQKGPVSALSRPARLGLTMLKIVLPQQLALKALFTQARNGLSKEET